MMMFRRSFFAAASGVSESQGPQSYGPEAVKRVIEKRKQLAELLNQALDYSYSQAVDPEVLAIRLERRRDDRYSHETLPVMSEDHIDVLLAYYGAHGGPYVA